MAFAPYYNINTATDGTEIQLVPYGEKANNIKSILLTNIDDAAITASLYLQDFATGAKYYILYNVSLPVGASLLLETDTVVFGNNQENAAYPSGLCAERIAFFAAGSNYPEQNIKQIAIVTQTNLKLNKTVMPCGACRQVMIEYEQKQGQLIEILLRVNDGNIFVSNSVQNILPFAFECLELKNT